MNDIVRIGDATLYHGDCREVLPALADKSAHLVVTDPPYGHNNNNGDLIHKWEQALGRPLGRESDRQARPIANDGEEANEIFKWSLPELNRILYANGCCCCCCGGGGPDPQFARWSLWMDEVFQFKQMIVWDKGPMGMGWHYRRSYETVLIAEKRGGSRWFDETNTIENIIRPGQYGIRKIIPSKDDHPTPKPEALAAHFIRLHSQPGEVVIDPFMGRGWVGVPALLMGRHFVGVEIDREHFDFACERIERAYAQGQLISHDPAPQPEQQSMEL